MVIPPDALRYGPFSCRNCLVQSHKIFNAANSLTLLGVDNSKYLPCGVQSLCFVKTFLIVILKVLFYYPHFVLNGFAIIPKARFNYFGTLCFHDLAHPIRIEEQYILFSAACTLAVLRTVSTILLDPLTHGFTVG